MKSFLKALQCVFFILVISSNVFSQVVSTELAVKVAQNFYSERYNSLYEDSDKSVNPIFNMNLMHTRKNAEENPLYYIFDVNNGGYMIVSAQKAMYPVLAYDFESKFTLPIESPAVSNWMAYLESQIEYAIDNNLAPSTVNAEAWNNYSQSAFNPTKVKSVSPLLLTQWNQDKWYNDMCPADAAGPNGRVYVGCVAVSMAQIMKYYNYPIQGNGSNSYSSSYGTLSANFGNTSYRWNEMTNNLTQSNSAVAELMYHAAVSVDMGFSPNGSSANTITAASAMKDNFKYATAASYKTKYLYTNTNWANMMIDNLDDGKPLIYSGSPSSGAGHAWNCDGYQGTDYFHMNWGWSGYYNGFFYLNALDVQGDNFNYMQGAVFDLYPGQNYPYNCTGTKTLTSSFGTFDDGSGPQSYQNNSDCSWLISPTYQVSSIKLSFDRFETEDANDIVSVYDGETTSAPLLGSFSGNALPALITGTSGKMLINFSTNASTQAAGFHASYTTTFPFYCSNLSNLTALSDSFSDGSGMNPYNPVTNCRWRIIPAGINSITLTFTEFNLTNNVDFLEVYDVSSSPILLDSYTGSNIPAAYTYNIEKIMLWFKAVSQTPGSGFNGFYTTTLAGMEDVVDFTNLSIYPNPSNDYILIDFTNEGSKQLTVQLFNIAGEKVLSVEKQLQGGMNSIFLSLDNFDDGLYFVRILSDKSQVNRKIVIQR
ncbi:MAG: C10 family peptidase [Bacteroidales bacterium]|nr:C10 family peptidase [Bacteroidales bacterium]